MDEFKYLRVVFTTEGRTVWISNSEVDRWIGAASLVMWTWYQSVVVMRELNQKGRLSVY